MLSLESLVHRDRLAGIIGGLWLWYAIYKPLPRNIEHLAKAMLFLAGMMVVGMFTSFLGWWVIGGLAMILAIMLIGVIVYILFT